MNRAGPPSTGPTRAGPAAEDPPAARAYLSRLQDRFEAAEGRLGAETLDLTVAGRALRLRFAGAAMRDALGPAFAHLASQPEGEPELSIDVWDGESSGVEPPPLPWRPEDIDGLGEVRGFSEGGIRAACDLGYGAITIVDLERRRALFQVPAAARLPWYERAAPLRPALHWLLAKTGSGLVHAGAVGSEDRGVLLAGPGGSGKSTLAVAALLRGMGFGGDDYMALTQEGEPRAHSVHATAKLSDTSVRLLPGLPGPTITAGPEPNTKNVIDVHAWRPESLRTSLTLSAIVVPSISAGNGRPAVRRISGAASLRALAPSTLFQLPHRDGEALGGMAALARALPAYALTIGDDPGAAAGALEEIVRDAG